ncbi:DUF2637 domain-containing protein [Pseudonocardia hispaniensis]|uniref:DUF2637 domain-containing protein n=1 Tax=Pseudonocardia hispaniensis TaxID=904933 RepID=A0ABW1J8H5_9PSEU
MTRAVMWAGLAVVLAAAAVLSFDGLRSLALAVGIGPHLAWLLPVVVDAGAAVSCAVWLSRRVPEDAARWARTMTWSLLTLTVAGNAAQHGLHAAGAAPPWWAAVVVGAIAPAVVGAGWHLAVLVGRATLTVEDSPVDPVEADDADREWAELLDGNGLSRFWETAPPTGDEVGDPGDQPGDRAARLIAGGAGRRRLARELGISEHEARQLLARTRETNGTGVAS